ncbi:MAG: hypothetical protein AAGA97_02435 [Pseudomonadota bacterium]
MFSLSKSKFVVSLIATSALAACGTLNTTAESPTLPEADQKGFVIVSNDCAFTSRPKTPDGSEAGAALGGVVLAIAEAAIPAITSFVFDRIAARAKAESRSRTASTTAKSGPNINSTLYATSEKSGENVLESGCITFVRPSPTGAGLSEQFKADFDQEFGADWRVLASKTMSEVKAAMSEVGASSTWYPELLAEFRIKPIIADGKEPKNVGFYLEPISLVFGATGAEKTGKDNTKDVGIKITLSGFLPDGTKGLVSKDIYQHEFAFVDLKIGSVYQIAESVVLVGEDEPPVVQVDSIPAVFAGQLGPIQPLPTGKFKIGKEDYNINIPLTATIVATEIEVGGDLQRAIIEALEKDKAKIKEPLDKALTEIISNAVGEQDEEEE